LDLCKEEKTLEEKVSEAFSGDGASELFAKFEAFQKFEKENAASKAASEQVAV
jgi:hypothetical protein